MSSPGTYELVRYAQRKHRAFTEVVEGLDDNKFHFSAKDNLCAEGFQARAGSAILDGYAPPFDATAIKRLKVSGGQLVGKTTMDEFGFGTFSVNSAHGVPLNPFDIKRSCGGSSGGAGAAACLIPGHVALGVSTGGSISGPSSFCGVVGLSPTYGRVSRYGLIDYGNSLDKVGLLSRSAALVRQHFRTIAGPDPKDPTSCAQRQLPDKGRMPGSLAVPTEAMANIDPVVSKAFQQAVAKLKDMGVQVKEVSMPSLRYALPAYYILATSEASTNLARYCGMRFGRREEELNQPFNDFFTGVRSESFGDEAKRRILLGTFCRMVGFRSRYYLKSLAVRQMLIEEYRRVLQEHQAVLTPTMPFLPPRFEEIGRMKPLEMYGADFLTVPPNLTGMPHISLPCAYVNGLPVGMQLVADHWQEMDLLEMALSWENEFAYRFPEVVQ
ncbi:MAG: Asp-tRNA(Asn)/Glu-tRNA(Gln) amidotransferase subunit GatA [Methanomassiliicoccales archaeon]|nr:Asp-tRNA(Asn)/Glu-tRNA(Gln) amidotransferase subunit GatA [Methanomassiliicoccales archaeon]